MKKIGIIIILATFSLNMFCQQDSIVVLDSTYSYVWDTIANDLVLESRYIYTYDSYGNLTYRMFWEWGSKSYALVGRNRSEYIYDDNGNRTESIWYDWDSETDDWVKESRSIRIYDANGNQTEFASYSWDTISNDWNYYMKEVSYWSELTTFISNNNIEPNYLIYPNPFADYTTIELSDAFQTQKIELIDVNGRTVRTIDNINSNSVKIHRDNLPSGIYFIRIQSDDTYVEKVIIR